MSMGNPEHVNIANLSHIWGVLIMPTFHFTKKRFLALVLGAPFITYSISWPETPTCSSLFL